MAAEEAEVEDLARAAGQLLDGVVAGTGSVAELRIPVRSAAVGREVEHVPERPDGIDMTPVHALFFRTPEQLRGVRVMDAAVAAQEQVEHRQLASLGVL